MPKSLVSAPFSSVNEPVSLRHWLWRHTRLPLVFLFLLFIAVEGIVLILVARNQLNHQTAIATRLAEMSRLAILEKSSLLLQAGFDLAKRELGALDAFVCEKRFIYVLTTPQLSACETSHRWGYRVIETPIESSGQKVSGKTQYSFVLQAPILPQEHRMILSLGLSVLLCLLGVGLIARLSRKLERELFHPMLNGLLGDQSFLIKELENLRSRLRELTSLKTQHAVNVAILERNAQVAHDIQSPLTVLLFALKNLQGLSDEVRDAIRSSVKRISVITDDLVTKKEKGEISSILQESHSDLSGFLKSVIEEKKLEYFHLPGVQWKLELAETLPKNPFFKLGEDLKRVLSNLLNNAVEARLKETGLIELGAKLSESGELLIWVKDNGKGFPPDFQMDKIGQGYTRGKNEGQGLGLKSAVEFMRDNNGELYIDSNSEQETRVLLKFCYTDRKKG